MLATILKSKTAINTTFAIIETFAVVRELKRELVELQNESRVFVYFIWIYETIVSDI